LWEFFCIAISCEILQRYHFRILQSICWLRPVLFVIWVMARHGYVKLYTPTLCTRATDHFQHHDILQHNDIVVPSQCYVIIALWSPRRYRRSWSYDLGPSVISRVVVSQWLQRLQTRQPWLLQRSPSVVLLMCLQRCLLDKQDIVEMDRTSTTQLVHQTRSMCSFFSTSNWTERLVTVNSGAAGGGSGSGGGSGGSGHRQHS